MQFCCQNPLLQQNKKLKHHILTDSHTECFSIVANGGIEET